MQEFGFPLYSDFMDIADVPRYDFSTRQIIDQAPRTNVGIVSLPSGQYTFPRSDDARSLLNYGPTAGEDTSSFIRDSDGNIIRNTELNPFNPSSQFFPYEPDYAGIMSTKAYLDDTGLPLRADAESKIVAAGRTVDTGPFGFYVRQQDPEIKTDKSGSPYKLTIEDSGSIYINPLAHRRRGVLDETELRDTIFHEGKHYFIDRFGQAVPITKGLQYEGLGGIRRRGPAGMFGTPAGTGQTGGPAGMGFAPSNNPTGFGSNIRIGKAKGGLVSINHLTRGM